MSEIESQIQTSDTEKNVKEETLIAISEAKSILEKLKLNNPEKYKKAIADYKNISDLISELVKSENKITKEELFKIKQELLQSDEINDDKISLSFISFKNDKLKGEANKKNIDSFLDSSMSVSELSNKQIGFLLSGIHKLGGEYINKFVDRFSTTDTNGLDYLIKSWGIPGKSIDKYLLGEKIIASKIKNDIVNKLIEKLDSEIRNKLSESIKRKNPNLNENEIKERVEIIIKKIKAVKEPEYVFQILLNNLSGDIETSAEVAKKELQGRSLEDIKAGKGDKEGGEKISKQIIASDNITSIITTRSSLSNEERIIFDKSIEQVAKSDTPLSTSIIISETISNLEKSGGNQELVNTLKKKFEPQIIQARYEIEEQNKINNEKTISTKQETLTYSTGTTIEYIQTNNGYALKTETGDIQISPEEFKIIEGNETAKENLVNFKNTLDELNLTGLWDYRNALFKGLGNVYIGDFNERDNYLNKNELKLFLVSILQSIGINISTSENISTVKKNLQSANLVGILGGTKDVNMLGNSTIENMFIQKFDPKRTGMLKQGKFEQALKSKV